MGIHQKTLLPMPAAGLFGGENNVHEGFGDILQFFEKSYRV